MVSGEKLNFIWTTKYVSPLRNTINVFNIGLKNNTRKILQK